MLSLLSYFKRRSSSIPPSLQWPERRPSQQSSSFNQKTWAPNFLRLPATRRREQNWDPLPCSWTKVLSFFLMTHFLFMVKCKHMGSCYMGLAHRSTPSTPISRPSGAFLKRRLLSGTSLTPSMYSTHKYMQRN